MKVPVSVLIPTRNEEANLAKCLASVAWADDVWVVDSRSTDRTAEIARAHGAHVVEFTWDGRGPRKKNWALERLPFRHEWLLLIDADEEVTPELRDEIAERIRGGVACAGFLARYHYYFLGRRLRHGDPLWKMALVRHRLARFERMDVPEVTRYDVELHEWLRVDGPTARLRAPLLHRDTESLRHHFDRHNVYSDWEALLRTRYAVRDRSGEVRPRLMGSRIERRRWLKRLFLSLPGKPLVYFFYSYLLRGGFLDGRAGFTYNVLKAIYWYQVSLKEKELRRAPHASVQQPQSTAAGTATDQRDAQLSYYREAVDAEEEITRPRCYPRPVQFLLDFKLRRAIELLRRSAGEDLRGSRMLVVCCGSGMESEFLAREGFAVTALDISPEAVARAGERSRRFDARYEVMVGDAERLPFPDGAFDFAFVHDGLHHLGDAYAGVREMIRVASRAVVIAEPADAALTHLAIRLGISGEYEEAGNFVYRLDTKRLRRLFAAEALERCALRRDLIYYQPWTYPVYRLFNRAPLYPLFLATFHLGNALLGRWGNSLKAVAWKSAQPASQGEQTSSLRRTTRTEPEAERTRAVAARSGSQD